MAIRERNEGLARLDCLPLIDEEFFAARLYTGPVAHVYFYLARVCILLHVYTSASRLYTGPVAK